jgi:hypothetical protein
MKHFFFFVGGWEFLFMTAWRQGWLQNGDASVFGSIEALVLFSSVWYACVMVGHRMMVWQKALPRRCAWWRSRKATTKGFVAKKINSVGFYFVSREGNCGSEVFRSLSRRKIQNNPLHNVFKKAKYLS